MGKFISIKRDITLPICNRCVNHIDSLKCKAFDKIPDEIIFSDNDHSEVLPNQKGSFIFKEA